MPAEFAALPPTVSDPDILTITHFKEVAARLSAAGENLRAQYYADYARAIAAGQIVVNGFAGGSRDARVTTTHERLSDGVTIANLRATATNVPQSGILRQPPACARVERSPIHTSRAADTFARHVAASQLPVIAQEPVEKIGPIKVSPFVAGILGSLGFHGRITSGHRSFGEYSRRQEEVLGAMAADVASAAQQQIQPRAEELAGDSAFQERVEAAVERIVEAAEVNRQSLMLEFMENPDKFVPDWVRNSPFNR